MADGENVPAVPAAANEVAIDQILQMAQDPAIDAAKITALVELREHLIDREREDAFNRDVARLGPLLPTIRKDGAIVHAGKGGEPDRVIARYAKFDTIIKAVTGPARECGIEISFDGGSDEVDLQSRSIALCVVLRHREGHVFRSKPFIFGFDAGGSKSGGQASASALSLGKRHALVAVLNIRVEGVDESVGTGLAVVAEAVTEALPLLNNAAEQGASAYREAFESLPVGIRSGLVASGEHDRIKERLAKE